MDSAPRKSTASHAAAVAAGFLAVLSGHPARGANDAFSTNPAVTAGSANFSRNFALGTSTPSASGGQTPASGDSLYFGASTAASLNNDLSSFTSGPLFFNPGAAAFTVNGNAFTLSSDVINNSSSLETFNAAITLTGGYFGTLNPAPGAITLNGGLSGSNVAALYLSGAGTTTLGGVNTLTFEGAAFQGGSTDYFVVGGRGAPGNLIVSGTITLNGLGSTASYYAVDSQGILTIASNGTLNANGGNVGFYIGLFNSTGGGVATANVSGALNLGANVPLQIAAVASQGTNQAILNILNGGVVTLNSAANVGSQGAVNATINLNAGGTLASNSAISGGGGVSNFNFNGGTLKALAPQTNWLNGLSTLTTSSNSSTIDANNQAVLISAVITDGATPGGLTITDSSGTGGGVVTLSGANTYSGPTTVNGGTLRLLGTPILPNGLKVMPLGDSITYGYDGSNAGYCGPLYNLIGSSAPNFQYVGSSNQFYAVSTLPQSEVHNEGHSSYGIVPIDNNLDGLDNSVYDQFGDSEASARDPNGGHWFDGISDPSSPYYPRAACYPDVILLMSGINGGGVPLSTEQTQLDALLTKILTERPNAKLIVAQLIPDFALANSYNAIVRSEVAKFQGPPYNNKNISTVDLNTGFPAGNFVDGTHPNDTGFAFMARQWYDGLVAACGQGYGPSPAISVSSPVILGAGGTLDMSSSQSASAGPLSGAGKVTLGSGTLTVTNASGHDSTFSGTISGSGGLTKAGAGTLTLAGAGNYSGLTEVSAGVLKITGALTGAGLIDVASGATLNLAGGSVNASTLHVEPGGFLIGSGTINGTIINNGTISGSVAGQTLSLAGSITNTGTISFTSGSGFQISGTLTNSGTVDLLTASTTLPANISNQGGTAFDSRALKVSAVTLANGSASVTLPSYTGHTFQLQRTAALSPASWQNMGNSQTGATGMALTFSDSSPPASQGFYRVHATP